MNLKKEQLQNVAISDACYQEGLAEIAEWEKEVKNKQTSFFQDLDRKILETDEYLNKLVDSYLDNLIDKNIYLQKKENLIKQKTELHQKKSDFTRRGISWIEPLRTFWNDAFLAKKLALSNDFHEIKSFVAKNGTNSQLLAKTVSWNWTGAFQILQQFAKKIASSWVGQSAPPRDDVFETVLCLIKSAWRDYVGTQADPAGAQIRQAPNRVYEGAACGAGRGSESLLAADTAATILKVDVHQLGTGEIGTQGGPVELPVVAIPQVQQLVHDDVVLEAV